MNKNMENLARLKMLKLY